jgi:hypothetical protein
LGHSITASDLWDVAVGERLRAAIWVHSYATGRSVHHADRRTKVAAAIGRWKQVIGSGLCPRIDGCRVTEIQVAVDALNIMLELAEPMSELPNLKRRGGLLRLHI